MTWLRQSTEITLRVGPYVDATDGVTAETGLAGAATEISKAGGAYATGPTLGTHDAEGWYPVTLTTSHTDTLGELRIKGQDSATHAPVWERWQVVPAAVYDAMIAGNVTLGVNVSQVGGVTADHDSAGHLDVRLAPGIAHGSSDTTIAFGSSDTTIPVVLTAGSGGATGVVSITGSSGATGVSIASIGGNAVQYFGTVAGASVSWSGNMSVGNLTASGTISRGGTDLSTLTAAQANAEADTALSDAGVTSTRMGYVDNLQNGNVALESTAQSILTDTAEIGTAGAGLTALPWNAAWDAEVQSEVADGLAAFWTSPATLVDLVWDEPTSGHATAGTTGKALTDAGSAGDPWSTDIQSGGYSGNQAGAIVYTNLDTTVSSRGVYDGGDITGNLSGSVGSVTGAVGSVTGNVAGVTGNVGGSVAGSVASVTGAVGSVTGNVGGSVVGSVASVTGTVGGIAGTITTLDALDTAQDAQHATTQAATTAIEADTQDIQSRIPAALVGGRIDATIDGTGMETGAIDAILTRQMTESYAADGVAPTLAQALFLIQQELGDFAISGTTITVKRLDGSTTAATFTLDDATTPTSRTRAT